MGNGKRTIVSGLAHLGRQTEFNGKQGTEPTTSIRVQEGACQILDR
ncbi:MAG: hypothetical protein R3C28_02375 [Pirellulaceae bacterium]